MPSAACRQAPAQEGGETFEDVVLPHLDAAYRLARWLMRNEDDAEDAVQESLLRALRYFRTFAGGHGRAWFLKIVRNTCWGWRVQRASDQFDEEQHSGRRSALDPETLLLQADAALLVERAMSSLPDRARDVLAFRELEGMSYRELSEALGVPLGTVMSSLWRARQGFRGAVHAELQRRRQTQEVSATAPASGGRTDTPGRGRRPRGVVLKIEKESHEC